VLLVADELPRDRLTILKLSAYIPATNTVVDLKIDVHPGDNNHDIDMR